MPNIYIEEVEGFNDLDKLYKEFEQMGVEILNAFKNFNLDFNADIGDAAVDGNSILRLIHYPPTDGSNEHRARALALCSFEPSVGG